MGMSFEATYLFMVFGNFFFVGVVNKISGLHTLGVGGVFVWIQVE